MDAELPYIEAKGTYREVGRQIGEAERARAEELLAAGLEAGENPVRLGQTVLCDHANAPLSICSHWNDDDPDPDQSVTTASMVWEPAERRVHVAVGQPCEHAYVTYAL